MNMKHVKNKEGGIGTNWFISIRMQIISYPSALCLKDRKRTTCDASFQAFLSRFSLYKMIGHSKLSGFQGVFQTEGLS